MKISFEVEKVLRFKRIEAELTPEQIEVIQEYADKHNLTFEQAFISHAEWSGILFDLIWDEDEEDYDYNVYGVEVERTE